MKDVRRYGFKRSRTSGKIRGGMANEKKRKENYREIVNLTRLFLEISIFTVDAITRIDKNSELKMVENTLEEN